MSPYIYQPVFTGVTTAVAIAMAIERINSPDYQIQERGSSIWLSLAVCVVLSLWIGFRPVSGVAFGDTVNYAVEYINLAPKSVSMDWSGEWIWQLFMNGCKAAGFSLSLFFVLVATGYIFSALWAVKIFLPQDPMLGTVFLIASLMFFPFAVNGLRNGLACHLVLLGVAFLLSDKWVPGAVVCLLAFGIHRSTMLPIAMVLVALFLLKDVRGAIIIWILSIIVSLFVGGAATNFFVSLGFDDRMANYANDFAKYSKVGFRWDFLLYSAVPVVYSWYICLRKKVSDNWFNLLSITYCLCNAFWILVIRSSFSNRFAYLSWFLYPVVMAYPLVNLPVWEDQDRKTGYVLLAYAAFTAFMWFVFWA